MKTTSKLDRIDPNQLRGNSRCTLSAWQRYEPLVSAAFAMHPRTYVWSPQNLAPSTVASRLRDAVRGCLAFGYDTSMPLTDLARWWSEVVVKHDDQTIYIGTQERVLARLRGEDFGPTNAAPGYTFPTLSFEELAAFQLLLSTNKLVGPVIIDSPPDITLLPPRPNVEAVQKDGKLILF